MAPRSTLCLRLRLRLLLHLLPQESPGLRPESLETLGTRYLRPTSPMSGFTHAEGTHARITIAPRFLYTDATRGLSERHIREILSFSKLGGLDGGFTWTPLISRIGMRHRRYLESSCFPLGFYGENKHASITMSHIREWRKKVIQPCRVWFRVWVSDPACQRLGIVIEMLVVVNYHSHNWLLACLNSIERGRRAGV